MARPDPLMHYRLTAHTRGGGYVHLKVDVGASEYALHPAGALMLTDDACNLLIAALRVIERSVPAVKLYLPREPTP